MPDSTQAVENARPCEAIEAVFAYGPQRCGRPSVGEAIDATWGSIHPVCEEHLPPTPAPQDVRVGVLEDAETCYRCGGENVIWSAPSPLWNKVMRGNDINGDSRYHDLVCTRCFIVLAHEVGIDGKWRLSISPEPEGLIYETPSGRTWDPEKWLWIEPADPTIPPATTKEGWCLCGVVDDQGDGTCGNCDRRILTDDDEHDCSTCEDCLHDGHKCCGCYDGACCQEPSTSPATPKEGDDA